MVFHLNIFEQETSAEHSSWLAEIPELISRALQQHSSESFLSKLILDSPDHVSPGNISESMSQTLDLGVTLDTMTGYYSTEMSHLYYPDGVLFYEGFVKDKKLTSQQCSIFYRNGNVYYVGQISENTKKGHGKQYYENGELSYQGQFENNLPNGKYCTLYYDTGRVRYFGEIQQKT
jgi:antitoxin component YwqK of YwqJK toxin-antitoxin module